MQKTEILIEKDAFGLTRPVEVAMDTPVAVLVPMLVDILQLPQADLFGNELSYVLRSTTSGRRIPPQMTLNDAGILPGTRLSLDPTTAETLVVPIMPDLGSPTLRSQPLASPSPMLHPQPVADPLLYSSDTLSESSPLPTIVSQEQTSSARMPVVKKRRSRRAFLYAGTAFLLGAGGAGVAYAAYRAYTTNHASPPANKATHPPAPTQPVVKTTQPVTVRQRLIFQHHQQLVRSVAWSPSGNMLASGADDNHLLIWDMAGNILHNIPHPGPVHGVAWAPDGQRLVTGSLTQVAFFNALNGNLLARSTRRHTQTINSVAWATNNGQHVVTGGSDKRAVVWETQNYQAVLTYRLHTTSINVVSWSADGQFVASSSTGGAVRVWNATNGTDIHGYYQDKQISIRAMTFAPNGNEIVAGADDGIVRFWNNGIVCTKAIGDVCVDVPQRLALSKMAIRSVSWSPDMRFLAVGADDGKFMVLQPAKGMKPLITHQQNAPVRSITWSPDGKHIATGTGNQVILWDIM